MGKERGSLEKNIFSHLRGCTFPGPSFGNMQGVFLKVNLTNSVFKHSPKERGKHLTDCVKVPQWHFVSSTL